MTKEGRHRCLPSHEHILETVTNLVDIDGIIKTVTDLVGSVTDSLNLDDLLSLPVKVNKPAGEVKVLATVNGVPFTEKVRGARRCKRNGL